MAVDVLLVYPYFNIEFDRSIFRYPPLGLGYLASTIRNKGLSVALVDCTFLTVDKAIKEILRLRPRIVGVYSMVTINHYAMAIAQEIKKEVELLVAGGPLPTLVPDEFLDVFDVVVLSEGERTFLELVERHLASKSFDGIQGLVYKNENGRIKANWRTSLIKDLDTIPFPARDLFPNSKYKWYWRTFHGYTSSSIITTRGCVFNCDFCSNPIFGRSYRERSPRNVVEEMIQIQDLGYDRIFLTDDCFTYNKRRVENICDLLIKGGHDIEWMCLSRADGLSSRTARKMVRAGCRRIFFGIESGDDRMLSILNKKITVRDAEIAVNSAHKAGVETGGFFILGYPGDNDNSILETLSFSSRLPLDYLSYSFPYPILGTGLFKRVQHRITRPEWRKQRGSATRHDLLFKGNFSEQKLRFAAFKGLIQHRLRKLGRLGIYTAEVFERITDCVFKALR